MYKYLSNSIFKSRFCIPHLPHHNLQKTIFATFFKQLKPKSLTLSRVRLAKILCCLTSFTELTNLNFLNLWLIVRVSTCRRTIYQRPTTCELGNVVLNYGLLIFRNNLTFLFTTLKLITFWQIHINTVSLQLHRSMRNNGPYK